MPKRTPFYQNHQDAGAKLIDFNGFEMPVQYDSIKKEHNAVRNHVGLFDVSHMGEFFVEGPEAEDLIQHISANDISKINPGRAQYTVMCYENGGIVDDLLIYQLDDNRYMMVVNAANREKDYKWVTKHNDFDAAVENKSDDYCLLAIQGPKAKDTLQKLTDVDLDNIGFYRFTIGDLVGFDDVIISETGYTGEKGFEVYFDKNEVNPGKVWDALMEAGQDHEIEPAGLGARDTLRLEMGLALYGNDISKDTNPLEARLGWLTKLEKEDFIGREALLKVKDKGIKRKLMGIDTNSRRIVPRKGYEICDENGEQIGEVTSGSLSITLDKGIAMGYVPIEYAEKGTPVYLKVRKRLEEVTIVKPPFLNK